MLALKLVPLPAEACKTDVPPAMLGETEGDELTEGLAEGEIEGLAEGEIEGETEDETEGLAEAPAIIG